MRFRRLIVLMLSQAVHGVRADMTEYYRKPEERPVEEHGTNGGH